MDLIRDPGTNELGFLLVLAGAALLAVIFAIQTVILSRRLRKHQAQTQRLEDDAFLDPLTGLPTRRLVIDRVQQALHAAERQGNSAAVYFIDLVNFKEINTEFGYDVGDAALKELANRWLGEVRAVDTVGRWNGDEFVIVTQDIGSAGDIELVLDRLTGAVREPLNLGDHQVNVSLSIGVSVASSGSEHPEDLIRCADAAMYRSHRSGTEQGFEIVGKPGCIEQIDGLEADPGFSESTTDYVRVHV